jgi:hypothetical protein
MPAIPLLFVRDPTCRGRGIVMTAGGTMTRCPRCGGSGQAPIRVRRIKFDYAFPTLSFTTAGSMNLQLQLDPDSYFEQVGWCYSQLQNGSVIGNSQPFAFTIQIVDQSTGWVFSNNPVLWQNFASNGQTTGNPGPSPAGSSWDSPLIVPFVWKPSSQIQAAIAYGTPSSAPVLVQFVMKGFKIYPLDQPIPEAQAA